MSYIYWHKVKFVNKEIHESNFKINQIVGFSNKESKFEIFNEKIRDIEPYVKFKYLGRTIRTGDAKEDREEFDKLIREVNQRGKE